MAEMKTTATDASVEDFLNTINDEQVRQDCWTIVEIMKKAARAEPRMWGPSIIGFGDYRLRYPDGREIDWMLTAFSPRKGKITLYVLNGFDGEDELLSRLGKHSRAKVCLYIKRLSEVDVPTLTKIIKAQIQKTRRTSKNR